MSHRGHTSQSVRSLFSVHARLRQTTAGKKRSSARNWRIRLRGGVIVYGISVSMAKWKYPLVAR